MASIVLDGDPLYKHRPLDIIEIATRHGRKPFDLGEKGDATRNREILNGFADQNERTSSELIRSMWSQNLRWGEQFCALRVGENLNWAVQQGIVERVPRSHRWRLLEPIQQFELVGPMTKRRAIRIHNAGALQAESNKLWAKELKRRERERIRENAKFKPMILSSIKRICQLQPNFDIRGIDELKDFAVGDIYTIAECRNFIEQSIDDLPDGAAHRLMHELKLALGEMGLRMPPLKEYPPASAEDLAALDNLEL